MQSKMLYIVILLSVVSVHYLSNGQPTSKKSQCPAMSYGTADRLESFNSVVRQLEVEAVTFASKQEDINEKLDHLINATSRQKESMENVLSQTGYLDQFNATETTLGQRLNAGFRSGMMVYDENQFHSYLVVMTAATWENSRRDCVSKGYHLARIESAQEDTFVKNLISNIQFHLARFSVWLDGTDSGHEGCWVWTAPNVTLFTDGYTNWPRGEPNNADGGEHCNSLLMLHGNLRWNDGPCHQENGYVCKRQIGTVAMNQVTAWDYEHTLLC